MITQLFWPAPVAVMGLIGIFLTVGCSDSMSPNPAPEPATGAQAAQPPSADAPLPLRETWDVLRIQGARAGYAHTKVTHASEFGRKIVKVEQTMMISVQRFGQTTEQEVRIASTETPEGGLLGFVSEIRQGPVPLRTTGKVERDRLYLETSTQGKTLKSSLPWAADFGGMNAPEQSLLRQPMTPGQKRTFRHLLVDNQLGETELTAGEYERVALLAGSFDLLRIESVQRLADGQKIKGLMWTDRSGDVLKTWIEPMDMEMYRVTKDVALAKSDLPPLDLGEGTLVKLDRPLPKEHDSRRAIYRLRLDGGNPADWFPSGPSQQVKKLDAHTAEVTVYALRPGDRAGNPNAPAEEPADADRQPNNFIQSDDAKILADAREAAGKETDPWRVALALEHYVHGAVKLKNFSQAFSTAAEVARTREGDCTEHAVYLAALARARGLPARVAVGLVYMPNVQAFGYHMWTEVCVDHRWIPIDGTLARGGIGGGHLKLAHANMRGAAAYSSFLPVLQVIGKLKIELVEAE